MAKQRGLATLLMALIWQTAAPAAIVQITDTPTGRFVSPPSISGDGRYTVFGSNANVGGLNPTPGGNVFVYDVLLDRFERTTSLDGFDPSISADGRWVSFTSGSDYVRRNADGSDEIFRYDRLLKRYLQVTRDNNGDGSSELSVISGNGKHLAFETSSNLRRRNPDLSNEVFGYGRGASFPISIDPNGDGESHAPAISADGKFVVFESTSDLTGRNADFSDEVMVYDVAARDVSQLTNDPDDNGDSGTATISGDGRFIGFISSSNVAGLNPDGDSAVFLANRARRDFTLVSTSSGTVFDGDTPSLSGDGRWMAFVSGFDVAQVNPDHNQEVLLYDRVRKTFTPITQSTACSNSNPKVSGDGTRIAFQSSCDYVGNNADHGREIFLADNPLLNLVLHAAGPVSLTVQDPSGQVITPVVDTIPRATYAQGDFDGDGIGEVRITIPQALEGTYSITLTADGGGSGDAVSADLSLNGVNVVLAADTQANLDGHTLFFNNQGFGRVSSRMTPINGVGSVVTLSAHAPRATGRSGPVIVRFTDAAANVSFDLGRLDDFTAATATVQSFKGSADGFAVKMRLTHKVDGTTGLTFSARNGDLSAFAGSNDVSMMIIVQTGDDTFLYHWRFRRSASGKLQLK